uniref:Uncharacterized protein n=1 Tax=Anopheles quadriannulatus TaxID=34691 RepID=A0A182XQV6_ANOQN
MDGFAVKVKRIEISFWLINCDCNSLFKSSLKTTHQPMAVCIILSLDKNDKQEEEQKKSI